MIISLLCSIFIFLSIANAQEPHLSVLYFNDNMTGDDFLSYGGFASIQINDYRINASGVAVTSNELDWRYDLGKIEFYKDFYLNQNLLSLAFLVPFKTKLFGQQIQNKLHSNTQDTEVHLGYDPQKWGLGSTLSYFRQTQGYISMGTYNKISIYTNILPSKLYSLGLIQLNSSPQKLPNESRHELSLFGGWKQNLSTMSHFSEIEKAGLFGGILAQINFWKLGALQMGTMYYPVQPDLYNEMGSYPINGFSSFAWIQLLWNPHLQWQEFITQW